MTSILCWAHITSRHPLLSTHNYAKHTKHQDNLHLDPSRYFYFSCILLSFLRFIARLCPLYLSVFFSYITFVLASAFLLFNSVVHFSSCAAPAQPPFLGSLNKQNTEALTWANVFDIGPTQEYCLFNISFAKETYNLIDQNVESLTWGQCLWHWPHVRLLSLLLGSFEKET